MLLWCLLLNWWDALKPGDQATWTLVFLTLIYVVVNLCLWLSSLKNQRNFWKLNRAILSVNVVQIGINKETGQTGVVFSYKNFGLTAATNVEVEMGFGKAIEAIKMNLLELGDELVPPNMEKNVSYPLEPTYISAIELGQRPFFLRVLLRWRTMDGQRYEHYYIGEYRHTHKVFTIKRSKLTEMQ
jgi:hypothetical protein